MAKTLQGLADKVGSDTIAATRAMSTAISLQCQSIQSLAEGADEVGMPQLASGREVREMVGALGAMVSAHAAQVAGRVTLMRKAIKLRLDAPYGENCYCLGAQEPAPLASGGTPLALS